jgi:glycine cleavage system transcriptional repressor
VLTAIGADRPGLVEEVSEFVFARGGNVEDSRMANMHGQFAIVMLVGGPQEALDRLAADLDALEARTAIHARLTPASDPAAAPRSPYRLTGQALDQPGLVHEVANALRGLNVNIETMDTTLEAAPVTGTPVFAMDLVLGVPDETPVDALRDELARVCDALNIDWRLEPL